MTFSFVRQYLRVLDLILELLDGSVQKVLLGPDKNAFTFLCLVLQRDHGRDTGNPRFYIQPSHGLAK